MDRALTVAEIQTQFASQWVLLEAPVTNAQLEVECGTVVAHSPDRDQVYRQAAERRPARFAILFTGTPPANAAIVL